ncbi:putative bifunctional diguanylate cyclase/phosphodiesterase [Piscinibacter sp.]|jgi:diguanylate cyclase (GGDEF)-like protein/PAS domain S-box-containing protein|uniref:putative bifunctional diguanylate cyclase/phosphodiesterase n=1 Tax=Piscinibacter sp. TaxID=1903157 RepID=UPI002F41156F
MKPDVRVESGLDCPELARGLIDGMLDAVWLVDARSLRVVAANAAAGVLMGGEPQRLCGCDVIELSATPEDLFFWGEVAAGEAERIESQTFVRRFDGGIVAVTRRVSRCHPAAGETLYVVALHDRSAQRRIEDELEDRLAELAATLESTADGILVTDLAGRIRSFNQTFARQWGIPAEMLAQRDDDALFGWMRRSVDDPAEYTRRLGAIDAAPLLRASDTVRLRTGTVLERVTLPQCSRGSPIGRVYSFRDITERLAAIQRIETLSHTDLLTGLPNRHVLAGRVEFAMAMAQRDGTPFALLFANLDRFKPINDTLGHAVGDRVLVEVAERFRSCLRQVDMVARLGGDEFVLLIHQASACGAETAARRVLDAMQRPFTQAGLTFTLTCSIGITLHPGDGADVNELIRRADHAMHAVKQAGRAGYRFHSSDAAAGPNDPRSRLRLDHAMRLALSRGDFRLHYQPQVDLHSGEVRGAEALIRWCDPELGNVTPAEFIPVAEESGFIVAIGDWVLREAVRQAAEWHAQGRALIVSVNVSALQFRRADFVERVGAVLAAAALPAQWLELELTESILVQDAPEALQRLDALSTLGVKLAIDDFGTGYSSLGYLKRFPIDRLKIDRRFVQGLPGDASDASIVQAIVDLGRALRLQIVAEGVETEAQRQFLLSAGCAQYQGFLFAPALDSASFEARLAEARRPKPPASLHVVG